MVNVDTVLRDYNLVFINLKDTTVNDEDYDISVASFLVLIGAYNDALEIFNGLTDLDETDMAFVDHQKGKCYYYLGMTEDAKECFSRSYCSKYNPISGYRLGRLLLESRESSDYIKGISLIRRAAFMMNMDAIYRMASICHDDIDIEVRSQDRHQEYFWSNYAIERLRDWSSFVRNHAFNLREGSYDMLFSKELVEETFALAKELKR